MLMNLHLASLWNRGFGQHRNDPFEQLAPIANWKNPLVENVVYKTGEVIRYG